MIVKRGNLNFSKKIWQKYFKHKALEAMQNQLRIVLTWAVNWCTTARNPTCPFAPHRYSTDYDRSLFNFFSQRVKIFCTLGQYFVVIAVNSK